MIGPEGTPYAKGIFQLEILFPSDFPWIPPRIKFLTRVYHLNIDEFGLFCLGILKEFWSPATSLEGILLQVYSILMEPEIDYPKEKELAKLYLTDKKQYEANAIEWTKKYAI